MSALGQKQTFAVQKVMSALPPKADVPGGAIKPTVAVTRRAARKRWRRLNTRGELSALAL